MTDREKMIEVVMSIGYAGSKSAGMIADRLIAAGFGMVKTGLCPNCNDTNSECACVRNKCVKCGEPVGNITFSHCDKCFWDKQ